MNPFKIYQKLIKAFNHPGRKSKLTIMYEYTKLKISNPVLADQYFIKYFFHKGITNFSDYLIGNKILEKSWRVNKEKYFPVLSDKKYFAAFFNHHKVNVVKTLGANDKTLFFRESKMNILHSPYEFLSFLFSLNNPGINKDLLIIKKRKDTHGGKDVYKISLKKLKEDKTKLKKIFTEIISDAFIIQEYLQQHEDLNKINPHSINTMRTTTYTTRGGTTKILPLILRTSLNNSYLDNLSKGGGYIGVHPEKGTLMDTIYSNIEKNTGHFLQVHPITNFMFKNFPLPFLDDIKTMVLRAASLVPQFTLVGWDVAFTKNGPVIIEGNTRPGLHELEVIAGGAKNNKALHELVEDIKNS